VDDGVNERAHEDFGDDGSPVRPRGSVIRRLRHERGWSPGALLDAVARASRTATGIARTLTPVELARIEDQDQRVSYDVLCLLADGFDCDPIDLLADPTSDDEEIEET